MSNPMIEVAVYLVLLSVVLNAVVAVHLVRRANEARRARLAAVLPPVADSIDLDAVRAAGDRAYLAVREAQAHRPPRRERGAVSAPRHLAVVA